MSDLKKIIKNNLANLFEEKYFDEMESNFGVDKDSEGKEQEQFDDMETVQDVKKGTIKQEKVPGTTTVDKTRKEAGKDAVSYYKDTVKKMKDFQTPDENQQSQSRIGESLEDTPKVNREDSDDENAYEAEVYGSGMQGLKYDDEGSEKHEKLEDRMDDLHDGDPTYEKLKKAGQDYKDHKYGEPDEYHNSPKVRVENKVKMEYKGVNEENIFKANGKLISEEQVIKISKKVPSRIKVDESVFAITDGENYYKLLWEGDEYGEATITNFKNVNQVNESIDKMKTLWGFDSTDSISTKKNITESGDDAFKRMFNKLRNSEGLVGETTINESPIRREIGSHDEFRQYGRGTKWAPTMSNDRGRQFYDLYTEKFGPFTVYMSADDSIKVACLQNGDCWDQTDRMVSREEAAQMLGVDSLDQIGE